MGYVWTQVAKFNVKPARLQSETAWVESLGSKFTEPQSEREQTKDGAAVFVCNELEMKDGDVRIVRQDRIEVGVYRYAGAFYAYRNHCLHQGGPACEGIIAARWSICSDADRTFRRPDLRQGRAAHRLPVARLGIQAA